MSTSPLNGFGGVKSGDAPESRTCREGLVVCSSSSTILTKTKWAAVRGELATPETNAYETTARYESRASGNGGSVPRCKLERAVERPVAGIQLPSRKSFDELCDESACGWCRTRSTSPIGVVLAGRASFT